MAKQFTLTQLRYFNAVAQLENMTAAAEQLLVTQSALSTAIAQLEKSIDAQLFVRQHARKIRLTDVGRQFARDLKPFLEQADALYESARGLSSTVTGQLNVGVFAPLAPLRLPAILQAFEAQYPGVQVSVLELDLAQLGTALRDGRCDVALSYRLGFDRGFSFTLVEKVPPHVLVHEGHAAVAKGGFASLRDFDGEPCIVLDLPHSRQYYEQLYAGLGLVQNIRHSFSGFETVRSFVANGHGYAVLNQRPHGDVTYSGGKVVALALTDDLPSLDVVLVRFGGIRATRRVEAFEQTCLELYGKLGGREYQSTKSISESKTID